MKILLTGATGFIGSHIGASLCDAEHEVLCLKRKSSDLRRCASYADKVQWIDADGDWVSTVQGAKPEAIVHAAWTGVTAAERENWTLQMTNFDFFSKLLKIADSGGPVRRLIALGSVAEYGQINGRVDENHPCKPVSAYGAVKLACLLLLQTFAEQKNLGYAWLRVFSAYGPGESDQWFMPSLLRQFRAGKSPQLTACEQRYDYLHVKDLAAAVRAAVEKTDANGVYNLSSDTSVALKEIVRLLRDFSGSTVEPAFGALPYRPNQSMQMEGNSQKFYKTFSFAPKIKLSEGIEQTIISTEQSR